MTARRWTPTGPSPHLRAAPSKGSGRSAVSPATGAMCSSATRSPISGTRCAGAGCRRQARARPADAGCAAPRQHAPPPGRGPGGPQGTAGSARQEPVTPAHSDDADGPVPFVLPGPPPARETLAGWQQWRATRGSFVPAPRLDRAAWRALPPRRRMLYDLHRAATHANLPLQQTPMSQAVTRVLRGRIESNALKHKPSTRAGVMITGGGYQGKTETACEVAADFEDAWLELHHHLNPDAVPGTRDLHAPVAYAQTPVTAKPKSTCKAILGFYGADTKNMDLPDLVRQVAASIRDHGTKALLLDDITRLRM